jgi:hypothetical protein
VAVDLIAAQHAERQVSLARRTSLELARLWRHIDRGRIAASWGSLLPQALAILGTSQAAAAAAAGLYVDDILEESGVALEYPAGRVNPGAFAGIASDGRPLASLLLEPAIAALRQIKRGASVPQALSTGRFSLDMITRTQVADSGRVAVGTAIVARPQVQGYVRIIVGKTCSRCLILAGKFYRWNAGFQRHPRCDCRHVPAAENVAGDLATDPKAYFHSLDRSGQDELLGKAGAEAVRNGADMARVVNARRGMQTASIGGQQVLVTTEAAGRKPRLMPEAIFKASDGDRKLAIRLLKQHGYIL